MTDADICRATADDAGRIRDLTRVAYAKWVNLIGREPKPMTVDYVSAVLEHEIDMLYVFGTLVGLLAIVMYPDHLWIENVAVAPEHHGQGWDRFLLDHAERKTLLAGHAELRLLTNAAFAANIALYRSVGYSIDRTEASTVGTTVYMSKRLGGVFDDDVPHGDFDGVSGRH